ncbi:MAG: methyltransferase domain-containing protein [Acidobacteria bacterium]|nr:methyltransferase domain-containing protein [Acidobacteriota bacterium]
MVVSPTSDPQELRRRIFEAVQDMYTEVAEAPSSQFHFPTGRAGCEITGYSSDDLDGVPSRAVESYAGTGCPFIAGAIGPGQTVLDIGCGSGTDLLICARKVGPAGRVIGIDVTPAMRGKAGAVLEEAGVHNAQILEGNAESIPLQDGSLDAVTSNGVINLVPEKAGAFREIYRVLKPGGRLQIADIVLRTEPSASARKDPQLWAECVVGAVPESLYMRLIRAAGFEDVGIIRRLDYFGYSSSPSTREVARQYGAISVVITARRPQMEVGRLRRTIPQSLALAGSLFAAFTSSLCTIGPLVFASLGLGGFAAGAWFAAHRPYFLTAAAAMLALGFYFAYAGSSGAGACLADDTAIRIRKRTRPALWIGGALVILLGAFPQYATRFLGGDIAVPTQNSPHNGQAGEVRTITFHVEGVECDVTAADCKRIAATNPAVLNAVVDYRAKTATISFDPSRTSAQKLAEELTKAGFRARL